MFKTATALIQRGLLALILLSGSGTAALADGTTRPNEKSVSIGAPCREEPSCVVVGDTHILKWNSPKPNNTVIVCIHGLGLCARAYKPLAKELENAGFDGYGVNVRGFGPDRDKAEYSKLDCVDTVDDVSKLLESIHKESPESKVFLIGESMGGALAVRIGAEHPELVDGVICSAPAWKILKIKRNALKGFVEFVFMPHSMPGPAGKAFIHQATKDQSLSDHWMNDSSHKLKLTLGEAKAFMSFISKTDHYAKRLSKPLLVVQGLNDNLVSPVAVARLFRDAQSNNKTFLIDGEGEHLVLEEGRFSPALVGKLVNWIDNNSQRSSQSPLVETINTDNLTERQSKRLAKLVKESNIKEVDERRPENN